MRFPNSSCLILCVCCFLISHSSPWPCTLFLLDQFLPFNPTDVVALDSPVDRFLKAVGATIASSPAATSSKNTSSDDAILVGKDVPPAPKTDYLTSTKTPETPVSHSYYNAPTHEYYNEEGAVKSNEAILVTPNDYETISEEKAERGRSDASVSESSTAYQLSNDDYEEEEIYYEEVTLKSDDTTLTSQKETASEEVSSATATSRRRRRRRRKRHSSGSIAGGAYGRRY